MCTRDFTKNGCYHKNTLRFKRRISRIMKGIALKRVLGQTYHMLVNESILVHEFQAKGSDSKNPRKGKNDGFLCRMW